MRAPPRTIPRLLGMTIPDFGMALLGLVWHSQILLIFSYLAYFPSFPLYVTPCWCSFLSFLNLFCSTFSIDFRLHLISPTFNNNINQSWYLLFHIYQSFFFSTFPYGSVDIFSGEYVHMLVVLEVFGGSCSIWYNGWVLIFFGGSHFVRGQNFRKKPGWCHRPLLVLRRWFSTDIPQRPAAMNPLTSSCKYFARLAQNLESW